MAKKNFGTLPAGSLCAVKTVKAAVKAFSQMGKKGYVTLECVTLPSKKQIVWASRNDGRLQALLPVFEGETITPEMMQMPMQPIKDGELFNCGEYFYQTCLNEDGEVGIRALAIFSEEETVRKACELSNLNVVTVELIQMYHAETQKYIAGAWLIKTLGGSKPYTLMYVDLRDRVTNSELNFEQVKYLTVEPGRRFSANGIWYELKKDEVDRLYLEKSPIQVTYRRGAAN